MSFLTHGGQGGHCTRAAMVKLGCLPRDGLSPGPGERLSHPSCP